MKEFGRLDEGGPYTPLAPKEHGLLGRIWALVASNWDLHEPAPAFRKGPFFVVEAAPPRPACHRWFKNIPTKHFYMKPWTFSEVLRV